MSDRCPVTGVKLVEEEINESLDEWRGESDVYWSNERAAWIVTGYDEVAVILEDAKRFWRDIPLRDGANEFWGRHLLNSEGARHRRMHSMHMRLTGEQFAENIRRSVAMIATAVGGDLVARGGGELAAEYADKVPFLVGCDFLGIDTSDQALLERLVSEMRTRARWKEALHADTGIPLDSAVAQAGLGAIKRMSAALLPTIRARRNHPRDDLISAFWHEGSGTFPDWGEDDMVTFCWSSLDNETKPLLRCLLYTICRDPKLQGDLRRDHGLIAGFVEEGLRYLSPFRTVRRVAKDDVLVGDKLIRRGDALYLITPLAHRDESKWSRPHSFSPERTENATHFAFGLGAGYCVGRYVGRVEAVEAVRAILSVSSWIELDQDAAEKPRWSGEMYHSVWPLHAILKS